MCILVTTMHMTASIYQIKYECFGYYCSVHNSGLPQCVSNTPPKQPCLFHLTSGSRTTHPLNSDVLFSKLLVLHNNSTSNLLDILLVKSLTIVVNVYL